MSRVKTIDLARALISLSRTGWMLRGIPSYEAESVAEHSFLAAYICLELTSQMGLPEPSIEKTIVYTILHDIGEALIGDIVTAGNNELREVKMRIEKEIIETRLENSIARKIALEYLNGSNREAKLAKLCDLVATYTKGLEYKSRGYNVSDLVSNVYNEIRELAVELDIWRLVEEIIEKHRDKCNTTN